MYKLCVFAGTTEGRELVEFLAAQDVSVTACVATEYGETLIAPAENLTISASRLTSEEMEELLHSGPEENPIHVFEIPIQPLRYTDGKNNFYIL